MEIRLAQQHELPILEQLARAIWPSTYSDIISLEQINFMLDWMYSTTTKPLIKTNNICGIICIKWGQNYLLGY